MVLVYFPTASYGSACAYRNSAKGGAEAARIKRLSEDRDLMMTVANKLSKLVRSRCGGLAAKGCWIA